MAVTFLTFDLDHDLGWRSSYYVYSQAPCHKVPLCQIWYLQLQYFPRKMAMLLFGDIWPWPFWPWPWVKVTALHILWSAISQSTFVPNLMSVSLIVSEKNGNVTFWWPLTLTFFTLTLSEGRRAIYILKRLVTKYLCAKFGDCSSNSFRVKFIV